MTITIKVRQADEDSVHYEVATGPRNLLKAIYLLFSHKVLVRSADPGQSWIEIDGREINLPDLEHVIGNVADKSRTQRAVELIARIKRGDYKTQQ